MQELTTSFYLADLHELNSEEIELIEDAKIALDSAYSPYSGFSVGASVLLNDGKKIRGNNQENVAYPSGLCAERVALFYVGAQFPNHKIKTIATNIVRTNKIDQIRKTHKIGNTHKTTTKTQERQMQKQN